MSGKTISNSETKIEALKLQSSAYGVTIPLVFGVCRISGNLIDYLGFQAVPHTETQGGKGGGVKVQNTTFTYKADVAMGLCHGVITEIPRLWRGKKLYEGGWLPTQILTATETYTPPGSGAMTYTVANAAVWLSVVEVSCLLDGGMSEGGSPITYRAPIAQGRQYTAAAGVITVLDNALRGTELRIVYQYAAGVRAQTAMDKLGLTFKPGAIGQAAWSALPTGRNVPYSGLAYVAGQGYDLGTGAQVENHMFEVVGPMAYHLGSTVPDVDPAPMLRAVLTQAQGGAGFPPALLDDWTAWSTYCRAAGILVSPAMTEQAPAAEIVRTAAKLTNTAPVWSGGRLKMVPLADQAETGNGVTYTPDDTPVYELTDESYTPGGGGGSPIRVRLRSAGERFNHHRVEWLNRDNQYNPDIAEATDAADIDANGKRSADVQKAHWLCTIGAARKVAQTLLQRSLYVNAEYEVPLPWHYALVEPADLLTLTDTTLMMDRLPVRVTVVEESEEGDLRITAEDYPPGTASPATYAAQAGSGYTANYNASPGPVDTPAIFEAPYTLATTGLEVYAAVRGTTSIWGGCQVWVSLDGTSYKQAGVVYGASRYGELAAGLAASATTMAVDGVTGAAQLLSGSAADADALQTLCYIGGTVPEYVAHEGAALTGAGAYTLSDLVRGAHGTTDGAHPDGAPFVRVDDRIGKSGALDLVMIGRTIYFKFCSFNIWGGGQQALEDAVEWPYTITGYMAGLKPTPGIAKLEITPPAGTLVTDYRGVVTDFSPATAAVAVRDSGGIDISAGWTFSTTDTNVVSDLDSGVLTITGFDPDQVDAAVAGSVIRLPFDGDRLDASSQRIGSPTAIGTVTNSGAGGPFAGAGYVAFDTAIVSGGHKLIYPFRSALISGARTSWALSGWIYMTQYPTSGRSFPLFGPYGRELWLTRENYSDPNTRHRFNARFVGTDPALPGIARSVEANSPFLDSTELALNTWYFVEATWSTVDRKMRLFLDGSLIATSTAASSDIACLIGHYLTSSPRCGAMYVGGEFSVGEESSAAFHGGRVADLDLTLGGTVHTASYSRPTKLRSTLSFLPTAAVDIEATNGSSTLRGTYPVTIARGAVAVVQVALSRPSGIVDADWQGTPTSYANAHVTVRVLVNGVDDTANWDIIVESKGETNDITFTVTTSGGAKVITVTAMEAGRESSPLVMYLSNPLHPTQYLEYNVALVRRAQPVVLVSGPAALVVAGSVSGSVPAASLPVAAAVQVTEGGVSATGSYTWAVSATSGITLSSSSGASVNITAMPSDTDAGTITFTGTRSGWQTQTWTVSVLKTRLLPPDGIQPSLVFPYMYSTYHGSGGITGYTDLRLASNGAIQAKAWSGSTFSWVTVGRWISPLASGAGTGLYYTLVAEHVSATTDGATGGTWLQLNVDREFGGSGNFVVLIATAASTEAVVATGRISFYSYESPPGA